jgi:hypothetical protein
LIVTALAGDTRPAAFRAVTLIVYVFPFCSPVITQLVPSRVVQLGPDPAVAVYETTGEPLPSDGEKDTTTCLLPGTATSPAGAVGAPNGTT